MFEKETPMNFPLFFYRSRCRDCNIHDRMSFASFFGAALIVIAIVLLAGAALISLHPPRIIEMRAFV
jgi:hypothetical protein